jgi:hypothetical protein
MTRADRIARLNEKVSRQVERRRQEADQLGPPFPEANCKAKEPVIQSEESLKPE